MIPVILFLSLAANVILGFLLQRSVRRLLQFDSVWEQIMPVLFTYSDDLRKMVSADLLLDNPEVIAFHKRNVRVLFELDEITQAVKMAAAKNEKTSLPRPDVG